MDKRYELKSCAVLVHENSWWFQRWPKSNSTPSKPFVSCAIVVAARGIAGCTLISSFPALDSNKHPTFSEFNLLRNFQSSVLAGCALWPDSFHPPRCEHSPDVLRWLPENQNLARPVARRRGVPALSSAERYQPSLSRFAENIFCKVAAVCV